MQYKVVIIGGCGHIGLPLGILLAENDFSTYLYDINDHIVESVNKGEMPYLEEQGPERLKQALKSNKLKATTSPEVISNSDIILFTIGTPVDEHLNPKVNMVLHAIEELLPYISSKQVLVFRSTLFPGTLNCIYDYLKTKSCDASLAFCPERIVQGKALIEIREVPQIISSFDQRGLKVCRDIFETISNKKTITVEPIEAELAKLFCNSWRYINFAISNQFYQIAESSGADFYKIFHAVTKEYPRMKDFSRAGFSAGPCLFKDTMQLASFSHNTFFLGHSAMLINEGMPAFVIEQLRLRLDDRLRGKTISILGMAFKADNDDIRDSLAFKLYKHLEVQGANVLCHDPFVRPELCPHINFVNLEQAVSADAGIIGAPHTVYKSKPWPEDFILIDIWDL